jgi:hypothetical protein
MEVRHDAQLKEIHDFYGDKDKKYIAETFQLETTHAKVIKEMQLKFDNQLKEASENLKRRD